jgi:hypothetical protein
MHNEFINFDFKLLDITIINDYPASSKKMQKNKAIGLGPTFKPDETIQRNTDLLNRVKTTDPQLPHYKIVQVLLSKDGIVFLLGGDSGKKR